MLRSPNKAGSDSDISKLPKTPSSLAVSRQKRRHDELSRDDFLSFKEEVMQMLKSWKADHDNRLSNMENSLTNIKKINTDIEKSLEFISQKYEDMQNKIITLEKQCKDNHKYIISLEEKVEELYRNSRRNGIEIRNIPEKEKENKNDLTQLVIYLSKTLNINLQSCDIKNIFRGPGKKGSTRPIIVELVNMSQKQTILSSVKSFNKNNPSKKLNVSHFGINTSASPVYVSEHLTPSMKKIYYLARQLTKEKMYKFCWTANGKVFIRKSDRSPAILIRNEAQFEDLKCE
ncbi:unnamed protein product [Parnassius apollo]|uniref:(apollo) hypothetical protein n=1 Tax=Parnassius apollo TaxID=110799 RepID=A0A8S3X8Z6_PARAO|nr:unnamed protein product [Parnassius apollo]